MNFSCVRAFAVLLVVALVSGCSIMHPVANDYDTYLKNNEGTSHFQEGKVADQYAMTAKTQEHHYEFRSALVGYAHVWAVDFGKILDSTMQSKDVVTALGTVSKTSGAATGDGNAIVFELDNYTFEEHGAHIGLTISVKNAQGETFRKSYKADGKTQGAKMFWAGPWGMKNAVQQSTKLALDEILGKFLQDVKSGAVVASAK